MAAIEVRKSERFKTGFVDRLFANRFGASFPSGLKLLFAPALRKRVRLERGRLGAIPRRWVEGDEIDDSDRNFGRDVGREGASYGDFDGVSDFEVTSS